jgi:hypothetical protein
MEPSWEVRLMTARNQQDPELLGTFSKFHSLPRINRGALASGMIFCFFCDSAAYSH